ncbi:hypothetical protein A1Q2_00011 [Trichosporon asahii var. asahii CBS 8904]|uniref:Uncharacterized protein n=1 Tax=Trichosporon asahii var. asahii (strain CBS 8904) TaxID=1220162 RepID=K1W1P2_TRIAC|nr:hypothetical protein A1Q2_00011 [Trichosporon asahii var. asahii CBS 8904]
MKLAAIFILASLTAARPITGPACIEDNDLINKLSAHQINSDNTSGQSCPEFRSRLAVSVKASAARASGAEADDLYGLAGWIEALNG